MFIPGSVEKVLGQPGCCCIPSGLHYDTSVGNRSYYVREKRAMFKKPKKNFRLRGAGVGGSDDEADARSLPTKDSEGGADSSQVSAEELEEKRRKKKEKKLAKQAALAEQKLLSFGDDLEGKSI